MNRTGSDAISGELREAVSWPSIWQLSLIALLILLPGGSLVLAQEPYREPWRPQFHFTPQRNWMNDPNGMVYYDGEYHLFYQYNPFGDRWGHMSWGHAVSRDLVHWEELPVALAEADGIMIFSGSAVVDWQNTSGFGRDGQPPLVAIYSGHYTGRPLQNQQIAYSTDRGRTWTKYAGNPVLDVGMADFRDPKVMWHAPTARWIMTVALPAEHKVHFYASPNLKEWKYSGEFGPAGAVDGIWECPDLFPLVTSTGETKWVLIVNLNPGGPAGGSGCQYFVGEFDGQRFQADPPRAEQSEYIPAGKLLQDFEQGYGDWVATGEAFGSQPPTGTLPNQQPVSGFRGERLVNTYLRGDATQGTLTSPNFEITAGYISFLVGGGAHAETRIELLVEGASVRRTSGRERERLSWESWDVREFLGKSARIRIVDEHSGGWGHINVDHILMADEPARAADDSPLWADFGADFYAAVSWSDVPQTDGRRLWLGWMSNWNYANDVPTSPWRSAMTVPRELSLYSTPAGWRLRQQPVRELAALRGTRQAAPAGTLASINHWLNADASAPVPGEIRLRIPAGRTGTPGCDLLVGADEQVSLTVDRERGELVFDRTHQSQARFHDRFPVLQKVPIREPHGELELRLLVDTSSVEVFVNDGEAVLTSLVLPQLKSHGFRLTGDPDIRMETLEFWPLQSIWK